MPKFQFNLLQLFTMLMVVGSIVSAGKMYQTHVMRQNAVHNEIDKLMRLQLGPQLQGNTVVGIAPNNAHAINDTLLGHLKSLPHLRNVLLPQQDITDAGCQTLAALPQMEVLDLRGCPVTADGVGFLIDNAPKLDRLIIDRTVLLDDRIDRARQRRPSLHVEF